MAVTVTAAAQTDIGRVRRQNQDTFGLDPDHRVYIVCDGMGGAAGGEIASSVAVTTFLEAFRVDLASYPQRSSAASVYLSGTTVDHSVEHPKDALFRATLAANDAVRNRALANPELSGMGCTLVAAHVDDARLLLVNVGDSRAYLVRAGECSQLTNDHSFLEEQVLLGLMTQEMADASTLQSVITRAVGVEEHVTPDLFGVDLEDGDLALLTSDGLTRHVADTEIARIVSPLPAEDASGVSLEERCAKLIALARQRGGTDNITCILLQFSFG